MGWHGLDSIVACVEQFFLTRDRSRRVVVDFEPDQFVDAVTRCEAIDRLGSMFVAASYDISGHARYSVPCFLLARR